MTNGDTVIVSGIGVIAGWSALVRYEGHILLTLLMRVLAGAVIFEIIGLALPGADVRSLGHGAILYGIFLAIPIAILASAFGYVRQSLRTTAFGTMPHYGTLIYCGVLVIASVWFATSFSAYLKD